MKTTFSSNHTSAAVDVRTSLNPWMRKALKAAELAEWDKEVAPPQFIGKMPNMRVVLCFSRCGWSSDANLRAEDKLLAYMFGRLVVMGVDESGYLLIDSHTSMQFDNLDSMEMEAGSLFGDGSFMFGCDNQAMNQALPWLEKAAERLGWTEPLLSAWKRKLSSQLHREWKQARGMIFACMNQSILAEMFRRRMPMNGMIYHWLLEEQGIVRKRRLHAAAELGIWLWYALIASECESFFSEVDEGDEPWRAFSQAVGVPESILRPAARAFGRATWGQTSTRVLSYALNLWRRTDVMLWPTQPAEMRTCLSLLDFLLLLYSDFEDVCEDAILNQMQWAGEEGWEKVNRLINRQDVPEMQKIDPSGIAAFWLGPMTEFADKLDLRTYACASLSTQMQWSNQWRKVSESPSSQPDTLDMLRRLVMRVC